MKRITSLSLLLLSAVTGYAQEVEMADTMRSEGKIYVVVAILTVILVGLIGYLILLDRKVNRLERKLDENKPN
ncbi:MAG: CcmD family protein [Cyclobacteriaceae bacterium]|jgi:CcmD family protein|nr:CcmD family protein [Cyclobacteriaceae bacterium]